MYISAKSSNFSLKMDFKLLIKIWNLLINVNLKKSKSLKKLLMIHISSFQAL